MPDQELPEEELPDQDQDFSSKRERQKARRAARLEKEAEQAKSARTRRVGTFALAGLVVVALIGGLIYTQVQQGAELREQEERAVAKQAELGCTPDERQPDLGGGHIAGDAASLTAEPPEVVYPDQPPSSGRHIGQVVASGVFDSVIDPRYTTHNLEHGYIVAWYSPDAPEDQVAELKDWAEDARGEFPKLVIGEYYTDLPDDKNFAYTAWFFRQMCEDFDVDVIESFTRAHYDIEGEGPEKGIPPHNVGTAGVADPADGDTLLPPLGDPTGDTSENVETPNDPDEENEETEPASG